MRTDYRSVYIAFDSHPSFKGASTHIHYMCEVLAQDHAPCLLLTLQSDQPSIHTDRIHQFCYAPQEPNILKRANGFTQWIEDVLAQQYNLMLGHFRDIWGGMAALKFPHIRTVFEVNGLPSVELPYRFPYIYKETLEKIKRVEDYCMSKSDHIITPSYTTKNYLIARGCVDTRITVIPNGAKMPEQVRQEAGFSQNYIVYAGALQPWQGADVLIKSLRYLNDIDFKLVICSSHSEHFIKPYRKLAEKLGVADKIIWKYQLDKTKLNAVLQHALFSVAPLTECSRNLEQGCSPLKILESMACGTPVIATQIPAVREIITHQVDGILCRPGRAADLARAMRLAFDYPDQLTSLGRSAQEKIKSSFSWAIAQHKLRETYSKLLNFSL